MLLETLARENTAKCHITLIVCVLRIYESALRVEIYEGSVKSTGPILHLGALEYRLAMHLKTILFDLGNVLMDFSHERMCSQLGDLWKVSPTAMREALFESQLAWRFERGEINELELKASLEEHFQAECSLTEMQIAAGSIFTRKVEMEALVEELSACGVRLVLLSNTCSTHIDWIRGNSKLLESFDRLVLSYEVGACKPEQKIFEAALEAIECHPQECLYTDDIADYVHAARQFGLNAVVFTGIDSFRQDLGRYRLSKSR